MSRVEHKYRHPGPRPDPAAHGVAGAAEARRIRLLEGQNQVLGLIAKGASVEKSLDRLAALFHDIVESSASSIHLFDGETRYLDCVSVVRLPDPVVARLAALRVEAAADPLALALRRREPVVVANLIEDLRWPDFRTRVIENGLRAVWVQPILGQNGDGLGVIALYHRTARMPDGGDEAMMDALCPLARIAIEHDRRALALQQADERLTSLASSLPGVVYQRVVTPEGDIYYTYISDGARDLFGVAPDEILADPNALFECHGPEYSATFRERLLAASRDLALWDVEAPIVTRDGQRKWSHAIARPHRRPDGAVVWNGIILDATRAKEANIALVSANRAKTEFLANMSHELRTPLNAIIGFSEVICGEQLGPLGNERYREYVADIHESGIHLLAVINDILDIAKIEAGGIDLDEAETDLAEMVEASVRLIADRAEEGGVALSLDLPGDLPPLRADQRKVKQILINLLSNAVKFTPAGGAVTVAATRRPCGGLSLAVRDTGIGIPAEHLETVTKPFHQTDAGLDRKYEGTGLGLALAKSYAELHGGRLELESEVGVGTTATVKFPAARVVAAAGRA